MFESSPMFGGMIGGWELLFVLFLAPFFLAAFAFWVWMLIHCIRNERLRDTEKLIWAIVIVFTHFIGAVICLLFGRGSSRAVAK
jgi:hypothetical protein